MHCLNISSDLDFHTNTSYSPVLPAVQLQFKQRLRFLWVALQTPHICRRTRVHNTANSTITGSKTLSICHIHREDLMKHKPCFRSTARGCASERRRERGKEPMNEWTLTGWLLHGVAEECMWEKEEAPLLIEPFREREIVFKLSSFCCSALTIMCLCFTSTCVTCLDSETHMHTLSQHYKNTLHVF